MNEIVECLKCHKTFEQTVPLKNIVCLHCDNKDMQETVYIVQNKEERGEE